MQCRRMTKYLLTDRIVGGTVFVCWILIISAVIFFRGKFAAHIFKKALLWLYIEAKN